jgi:putative tryptophan/tyrosine transport system substrate-binding protein
MRRRDIIKGIIVSAPWPLVAHAQQAAMPVVGFLNQASAKGNASFADAFRKGLSEADFVEGRNVTVEYRWAEGQYDRLPFLAQELVQRKVVAIGSAFTLATRAAMKATSKIPIVFVIGIDPIQGGFVSSFNRPGGNVTGVAIFESQSGKSAGHGGLRKRCQRGGSRIGIDYYCSALPHGD